jgi:hypothetical protein
VKGASSARTGKRAWVGVLWQALAMLVLWGVYQGLVHWVADREPIVLLTGEQGASWLGVVVAIIGLRLVVLVVLPGWLLWLLVSTVWPRQRP